MNNYFFEIPVYSMTKEVYDKKMELVLEREKKKYNLTNDDVNYNLTMKSIREYAFRDWEYNQIVGFLKLYCNNDKTRIYADYWKIDKKRIPFKLDKKNYKFYTCYPEWNIDLSKLKTSVEIFTKLVGELPSDLTNFFTKLHLDLYFLKKIGPFIDWINLLEIKR